MAQEQQRLTTIPDRMPTMESIDEMILNHDRITHSLQRLKLIVYEQRHLLADHQLREQGGKAPRDYDDNQNMYDEDPRNSNFGGSDGKKRRGVSDYVLAKGCHLSPNMRIAGGTSWQMP